MQKITALNDRGANWQKLQIQLPVLKEGQEQSIDLPDGFNQTLERFLPSKKRFSMRQKSGSNKAIRDQLTKLLTNPTKETANIFLNEFNESPKKDEVIAGLDALSNGLARGDLQARLKRLHEQCKSISTLPPSSNEDKSILLRELRSILLNA